MLFYELNSEKTLLELYNVKYLIDIVKYIMMIYNYLIFTRKERKYLNVSAPIENIFRFC